MNNLRILGAPSRYIQGQGAISSVPEIVSELASSAFVLADTVVTGLLKDDVAGSFEDAGSKAIFSQFDGECTRDEIYRQTEAARHSGCEAVVGIGGGKTIDTAKGVSLNLGLPIVIVPTIASNDAPTSRLIVVYDQQHRISEVLKLPKNPDAVVVDTKIIAAAPPRFLVAGIGDAISKKFEAGQCALTGARNFFDGLPTMTALTLCDSCYSILRLHGVKAVDAVKKGSVDEHVENTVEATVLLSGLGFESGGLALAHGLTRGLTAQPEAQHSLHGELVAWGLLVQLIAEGRDRAFLDDIMSFYLTIGLPTRLSDLGFSYPDARIVSGIAETTKREAPYVANMEREMSTARLIDCILELETISSEFPV